MISFGKSEKVQQMQYVTQTVAENMMRPVSRHMDEQEGEIPWDYINFMHQAQASMGETRFLATEAEGEDEQKGPRESYQLMAHSIEMLSWGDAAIYLCTPRGGLGAAAVQAAGTREQKEKFLPMVMGKAPAFSAMAITEAGAGSDNSAIQCRAVLDEANHEWVLNGEKIFVTAGHKALVDTTGFVVIWATIDPSLGRAGIRSFVVEAGNPGIKVAKKEKKLGIRASDTVSLVLSDCRVPYANMLGDPKALEDKGREGFKGAMQTFNVTRPLVAASALGVARAALEEVKRLLVEGGLAPRSGLPRQKLTHVERELIDMERMLRSSWLLTLKAVWMSDNGMPNAQEAAMSKLHAGEVVTRITQKAVELLGPLGYSRVFLLEKWFRDAKINDIFEGTGQINRLIAARQLLGYSGKELR
jgi:acyl-CoA dehydrogenase